MEFLQQNWHWAALAAFSATALLVDLVKNRGNAASLSPVDATLKINREDAIVIDVREVAEFAQGTIPNARNIPVGEVAKRTAELEKFRNRPLILCCQSGARSAAAMETLKKAGFEQVFNLHGGIAEWERAGQPLQRKKK